MTRKLDDAKKKRILQVLSFNFAEPKRYKDIFVLVSEKREGTTKHIGTKKTLNLYLKKLQEDGLIIKNEINRRNVTYSLSNFKEMQDLQKKYYSLVTIEMVKYRDYAQNIRFAIANGKLTSKQIEEVVLSAWLKNISSSTYALSIFAELKQPVDLIAHSVINDWVLVPFALSSKIIESCYNYYPKETLRTLETLKQTVEKPNTVG